MMTERLVQGRAHATVVPGRGSQASLHSNDCVRIVQFSFVSELGVATPQLREHLRQTVDNKLENAHIAVET
jgi:hypothetical protein